MHIEEHDKLLAGSFPDSQHGFIFGPKGSFAYTTNAGNNWTRKDMQITPGKSVLNCHFYDSKTGIAMTDKLYRTEDGGLSWTVTFPYPTAKYYPITESAGYLKYFSTTDSVYYTADQGLTFELQHKGSVIWDEIDFVNPYLAYCTNSDGIFRVDFPRPVPEPADTQRVAVPAGWSLFSTYLHLRDSSIANVFAGTNISIIKTMDKQWQMIYPAYMNTLPHIHAGEGYLIYSENPETLVLLGKPMTATVPHLAQGWNLYGCQSATEEDIDILFQGVSAVKNEDGFWQPTGVSSISKIKPGKGYFIFKE